MKKRALLLGATGLVGRAAAGRLEEDYQIIPAAGRCAPENGYCLPVEAPEALADLILSTWVLYRVVDSRAFLME